MEAGQKCIMKLGKTTTEFYFTNNCTATLKNGTVLGACKINS